MLWILRRTGAVNLFNSLNNNCSSSKGTSSDFGGTQDKYVKRPARKAYGRLMADADDVVMLKQKIDDPYADLDNFEMLKPNGNGNGNGNGKNNNDNDNAAAAGAVGVAAATTTGTIGNNVDMAQCTAADCQGNFVVESDLCDLNICRANGASSAFKTNSSAATAQRQQDLLNENAIKRLHAMQMSDDDDDYDETLTCNVCDRSFHCHRQLASHQQKKRHFGCNGCDSLFPSLMLLEHHKEEFEHWSDDDFDRRVCCRRNRDEYFTDTDSYTSEAESEDMERLL